MPPSSSTHSHTHSIAPKQDLHPCSIGDFAVYELESVMVPCPISFLVACLVVFSRFFLLVVLSLQFVATSLLDLLGMSIFNQSTIFILVRLLILTVYELECVLVPPLF